MSEARDGAAANRAIAALSPQSRGRLLAVLARRFSDLDLAEDALQEALTRAMTVWPKSGVPESTEAWLAVSARRIGIDLVRRDVVLAQKLARLQIESEPLQSARTIPDGEVFGDDQLGLMFACAHPTLREDERLALTLRFVAGLETTEVAHALLVSTTTMQQRLVRAKKRIRTLGVPFTVPHAEELADRLDGVLRVIYVLFGSGHVRGSGAHHVRDDLTAEAIRLGRLLHRALPQRAEVSGLLGLMLLTEARRPTRLNGEDRPIPLKDQDRSRWDQPLITEGIRLAELAAAASDAGRYAVSAAIAAVQAEGATYEEVDWAQIAVLYQLLARYDPSPVVRLGGAVASGRARGPEWGMVELDALADDSTLQRLRSYHIARAITLAEIGRPNDAAQAYRLALDLPGNEAEDAYLTALLADIVSPVGDSNGECHRGELSW